MSTLLTINSKARKRSRSLKSAVLALAAASLVACSSTSTDYVVADDAGDYGYSERKLTESRYRVSFTGNSKTPVDLVQDYALLRAAELTVQKNYDWFEVAERSTMPQVPPDEVGAEVAVRTGGPTHTRCGLLGCSTTRYSPAYSIETVEFPSRRQRYTASIEVVMGSGANEPTRAYDAREVIESVRADI
ncbi:MAG: hypothetical protein DHS20C12_00950 [Pseudohongiella sp.]|nr:MAG: hypothetical protein DHS20C12_00950 [Pseudohongiella sp.]